MNAFPPAPPSFDVHVVPHVHCERAGYGAAGPCPRRFVALIDDVLNAPPTDTFFIGGDVSVLEDYLALRPQRRAPIAERLQTGCIEAGPWYVLPDELLPGGEALVRNLSAGRQALRRLGGTSPVALYSPVAFGHPAALPILTRGFGFLAAIVWRGFGGARWPAGDSSRMRAPDGTESLLFHLPPDGRGEGSQIPVEEEASRAWWRHTRGELGARSKFGVLLVLSTVQHQDAHSDLSAVFETLAAVAVPDRVRRSTLSAFAKELHHYGRRKNPPLAIGELRDSYGYTLTLQGTFAARAHQKRASARLERVLVRDVEPWVTLAAAADPAHADVRRAMLERVWRTLLLCHAHTTLCGCCSDAAARAMDLRLNDARRQALDLRENALATLLGRDENAVIARDELPSAVVLRNPSPRSRGGLVELRLHAIIRGTPPDGGAVDGASRDTAKASAPAMPGFDWTRVMLDAGRVPMQILATVERDERPDSSTPNRRTGRVAIARVLARVSPLRGFGTTTLPLALSDRHAGVSDSRTVGTMQPVRLTSDATPQARWTLDNGLLRFEINSAGETTLTALLSGRRVIQNLIAFESVADRGDLYTHSPVGEARQARFAGVRVTRRGPLRGELIGRWELSLPTRPRARDAGQVVASPRERRLAIRVRITLDADAHALQLRIAGSNRVRDHRLRIVLATGVMEPAVVADAAFGPIARRPLDVPPDERVAESPPPTAPLHRFVTLTNATAGATILSDGLAEYEAKCDGGVAVTLIRAVGRLSRSDLPERPGHVDRATRTPAAQCLGPFRARLAIFPHQARDRALAPLVERAAEDMLSPLRGTALRSRTDTPPAILGAELSGDGLTFSALISSDDGAWMLARCVNVTEDECEGVWRFDRALREAHDARLDGTLLDAIAVDGATVSFIAGPRAVVTIAVR